MAALFLLRTSEVFSCQSFVDPKGRSAIDLAPPEAFVAVCAEDNSMLCTLVTLSEEHLNQKKIVGYFVLASEVEQLQSGGTVAFTSALAAYREATLSPEAFQKLKDDAREKRGDMLRDAGWPYGRQPTEYKPMGILDETENSISVGVLTRLNGPDPKSFEKREDPPKETEITVITIFTAVQLNGETLSLKVDEQRQEHFDGASTKRLAADWLGCIKTRNR